MAKTASAKSLQLPPSLVMRPGALVTWRLWHTSCCYSSHLLTGYSVHLALPHQTDVRFKEFSVTLQHCKPDS